MIGNYLKVAFRKLSRQKLDSAISIGGLALGISCCILLVLFVHFEWSYDSFHDKSDRIFRVITQKTDQDGETGKVASTPYQMGPELAASYPELERYVRINKAEVELQRTGSYQSQQVLFADSLFFEMFTFGLKSGSARAALERPGNIILTESKAQQLFGNEEVVGRELVFKLYQEERTYRVAAVVSDPPANSSITFEMVMPYDNYMQTRSPLFRRVLATRWDVTAAETYVLLQNPAQRKTLESKLDTFADEHFGEEAVPALKLQPLEEMYLDPGTHSNITASTSPVYSWILVSIAAVVLIIACINFMTLTLSRSASRSGEIGIRKATGANRFDIGMQYLGEALLICLLAFGLGLILAELALPYMQELVDKPMPFSMLGDTSLWWYLGGLIVASALLTGLYPAYVMARTNASEALKSGRAAERIPGLVKGLVVVQFALSMLFVSSAFIMHKQLNYVLDKDLGFSEDNVVLIRTGGTEKGGEIFPVFQSEALQMAGVRTVSATFGRYGNPLMTYHVKAGDDRSVEIGIDVADERYLETLQVELLQGRGFSEERPSDQRNGIIVNKAFVEAMGWERAIGKVAPPVDLSDGSQSGDLYETMIGGKTVIGVVEDFHYESLHNRLRPLALASSLSLGGGVGTIWVKVEGRQVRETLAALESTWNEVAPGEPFNYAFLDEVIQQQYQTEERWREIVDVASLFAIALACFGLIGLAALSARRRAKEIGIRKVLGATVSGIVALLSKDFLKLVALGFVLAVPMSLYAMNRWLADFAYKIEIGAGVFVLAGGAALLIALLTVSWQAVRAALANPVDSLRSE